MKHHIAATPRCKHAWEKEIMGGQSNGQASWKTTDLDVNDSGFDLNTWDDLHDFVPEASPEAAHFEVSDNEGFVDV